LSTYWLIGRAAAGGANQIDELNAETGVCAADRVTCGVALRGGKAAQPREPRVLRGRELDTRRNGLVVVHVRSPDE